MNLHVGCRLVNTVKDATHAVVERRPRQQSGLPVDFGRTVDERQQRDVADHSSAP